MLRSNENTISIEQWIQDSLAQANKAFRSAEAGEPGSRYKSWEYCHNVFADYHRKPRAELTEKDFDYLALTLAFYLASWGMYRGSSFLLNRDYKAHIPAVKIIMERQYDLLWDFEPTESTKKNAAVLLFGAQKTNAITLGAEGLFSRIKKSYSFGRLENAREYNSEEFEEPGAKKKETEPTDTLITKILLGTHGCIPGFDTCFVNGVSPLLSGAANLQSGGGSKFISLCDFGMKYRDALVFYSEEAQYPLMKCIDLLFWRRGFLSGLLKRRSKDEQKEQWIENVLINEGFLEGNEGKTGIDELTETCDTVTNLLKSKKKTDKPI